MPVGGMDRRVIMHPPVLQPDAQSLEHYVGVLQRYRIQRALDAALEGQMPSVSSMVRACVNALQQQASPLRPWPP